MGFGVMSFKWVLDSKADIQEIYFKQSSQDLSFICTSPLVLISKREFIVCWLPGIAGLSCGSGWAAAGFGLYSKLIAGKPNYEVPHLKSRGKQTTRQSKHFTELKQKNVKH